MSSRVDFAAIYAELKRIAEARLRAQPGERSLQATELVHEVFLKLAGQNAEPRSSGHLMATAAQAMRWLLVDRARRRLAAFREPGRRRCSLSGLALAEPKAPEQLLALDEALRALEAYKPRLARIVEMRFFAGATIAETAAALQVSEMTVKRDWQVARARLLDWIEPQHSQTENESEA
jgi:RNA polymerase sigma factor (TIGR02999 family)